MSRSPLATDADYTKLAHQLTLDERAEVMEMQRRAREHQKARARTEAAGDRSLQPPTATAT